MEVSSVGAQDGREGWLGPVMARLLFVVRWPPGGALDASLGALSITRTSKGCPDDHGAVDHQPDSACALGFCRTRTVVEGQELLNSLLEPINDCERPLRFLFPRMRDTVWKAGFA